MRRLELIALIFRRRLERLDRSKVGAKHIWRVGHAHLPGKDIEYPGTWHRPGDIRWQLLPGRIEAGIDAGKIETTLGSSVLTCNAQCCLRCLQVWIVAQPLLDQGLERFRPEQCPPLAGNVAALMKALRLAIGGGGARGQSPDRIAIDGRSLG